MKVSYIFLFPLIGILIMFSSCVPSAPTLISLTDRSTISDPNPTLKWNSSKNAASYGLKISTDSEIIVSEKGLTNTSYVVPQGNLLNSTVYYWQVNAANTWGTSEWSEKWTFVIQCQDDFDDDGIPNQVESDVLKTDPNKKTLFIKPSKITNNGKEYWPEFVQELFPKNGTNGRIVGHADIPPFSDADIEIVVIGDDDAGHPYPPMRKYNYNPVQDLNHPPCDILEIVLETTEDAYCKFCSVKIGSQNVDPKGHTFFIGYTWSWGTEGNWSWDTKGYTSSGLNTGQFQSYGNPMVYQYPLDNYFEEGAYKKIAENEPAVILDLSFASATASGTPLILVCTKDKCGTDTPNRSPMNLGPMDPGGSPPGYGEPNLTVEFNEISFYNDAKIEKIGLEGKGYDKNTVLKRTIVHEMGHAVSNHYGHCQNPDCIMYEATVDWEMHLFGTGSCGHKELIKAGVYNKVQ